MTSPTKSERGTKEPTPDTYIAGMMDAARIVRERKGKYTLEQTASYLEALCTSQSNLEDPPTLSESQPTAGEGESREEFERTVEPLLAKIKWTWSEAELAAVKALIGEAKAQEMADRIRSHIESETKKIARSIAEKAWQAARSAPKETRAVRWMPIESAPKTGEHVLVANFDSKVGFGVIEGKQQWPWQDVAHYWPFAGEEGWYSSYGPDEPMHVTHWQPLLTDEIPAPESDQWREGNALREFKKSVDNAVTVAFLSMTDDFGATDPREAIEHIRREFRDAEMKFQAAIRARLDSEKEK